MKKILRNIVKKVPIVNAGVIYIYNIFKRPKQFPGSKEYWEKRYSSGGFSGSGSYGKLAEFKAGRINLFCKENKIETVIDFGCGDGNQLSLFNFKNYIGLDVSRTTIKSCINRFASDKTKSFFLYDSECF